MFDNEFKTAIQNLSSTEKDKLILRLLRRDMNLANRLYFELVDVETVEQKRKKMAIQISKKMQFANENFYTIDVLLWKVKECSRDINEHLSITKDKFGEIALNIQLLYEVLTLNRIYINNTKPAYAHKFFIYIIARTYKILLLINALHADYLIEFKDGLEKLGSQIGSYDHLMRLCIQNGLDVNWLLNSEIPENIVSYHKHIKANGFLK